MADDKRLPSSVSDENSFPVTKMNERENTSAFNKDTQCDDSKLSFKVPCGIPIHPVSKQNIVKFNPLKGENDNFVSVDTSKKLDECNDSKLSFKIPGGISKSMHPVSKQTISKLDPPKVDAKNVVASENEQSSDPKLSFKIPGGIHAHPVSKNTLTQLDPPKVDTKTDKISHENTSKTDKISQETYKTDQITHEKKSNSNFVQTSKSEVDEEQSKISSLLCTEESKKIEINFPYNEPSWTGLCEEDYKFEVIKNGSIIDTIDLTTKPFHVFGRLPSCDVTMEHPSLSRYHAVLQYSVSDSDQRRKGWYLFDLDSTHGTWINKVKVQPKVYNRVRVGHVLKFGGSSRLHILQGPEDDQEAESDLTITQQKEQRERHKKEAEILRQAEILDAENRLQKEKLRLEDQGCSWGIDEDAVDDEEDNPFMPAGMIPQNEHLYVDDPKKALKGYFEREGYDLPEYQFVDSGPGKHKCMVELPIDSPSGEPIIAEVVLSGKKKDAVIACALEACRLLDRQGELRKSKHESHKPKGKNWEDDDFYDSDEDTFLDRTGIIEKKRILRMKKAGKMNKQPETYDSLFEKHTSISAEISSIQAKLETAKAEAIAYESEEVDALDAYMSAIKSGAMDTKTKMKLKCQLIELKQAELKLRRMVNVAKPASLPEMKITKADSKTTKVTFQSFGKIHKGLKKTVSLPAVTSQTDSGEVSEERMDVEEDDDEEQTTKERIPDVTDNVLTDSTNQLQSHVSSNDSKDERVSTDQSRIEASTTALTDGSTLEINVKSQDSKSDPISDLKDSISPNSQSQEGSKVAEPVNNRSKDAALSDPCEGVKPELQDEEKTTNKGKKRTSFNKTLITSKKSKHDKGPTVRGDYDSTDPDYAVWLPPKGQSGDGKTHLNDKFGY